MEWIKGHEKNLCWKGLREILGLRTGLGLSAEYLRSKTQMVLSCDQVQRQHYRDNQMTLKTEGEIIQSNSGTDHRAVSQPEARGEM